VLAHLSSNDRPQNFPDALKTLRLIVMQDHLKSFAVKSIHIRENLVN
jgi:hypothetical protein